MEEILNKWTGDFENKQREFHRLAADVSDWDRLLMENGHNVTSIFAF